MQRSKEKNRPGRVEFRVLLFLCPLCFSASLPLDLPGVGPGAETRIPMAMAVIGGVTVSTFLTLFVVPAAYLLLVPLEKEKITTRLARGIRWAQEKIRATLKG